MAARTQEQTSLRDSSLTCLAADRHSSMNCYCKFCGGQSLLHRDPDQFPHVRVIRWVRTKANMHCVRAPKKPNTFANIVAPAIPTLQIRSTVPAPAIPLAPAKAGMRRLCKSYQNRFRIGEMRAAKPGKFNHQILNEKTK